MSNKKKNLLYGSLGLLSVFAASLGYVYGHKPFTVSALTGVLRAVWQIGVACAVACLAAGVGGHALRKWRAAGLPHFIVTAGVGFGILSLTTLLLGVTVGYSIWIITPLFGAGLFLLRRDIARWLLSLREFAVCDGFETTIAIFAGILIFPVILTALAPPVKFDALVYHLSMPQMYLDAGRMIYLPEITYWGMPQLTEMNYLLAMRFGGAEAAALLGIIIGLIALAGIFGVSKEYFGTKAAWMSVAALLAGETLSGSLGWGYADWTSMLFGAALLAVAIRWHVTGDKVNTVLMGALAGFALSVKYTSGVLLLTALLAALIIGRQKARDVFLIGAVATLISLPWWVKNFVMTGNPFYPLLFASGEVDATRLFFFSSAIPWRGWGYFFSAIFLPIQATVYGIEGGDGFSASIGPLLLAFSPLAWVGWRDYAIQQQKAIRVGVIITIGGMILWGIGSRFSNLLIQTRLFYAIFPAWAFLAGVGFSAVWNRGFDTIRLGRMAGLFAVFMLGLNAFHTLSVLTAANPFAVVLGLTSPQTYIARNLGAYPASVKIINALPENSRVVMLWEARGYYCIPRCDPDEVIDRWVSDLRREGNPRAVLQSWKEKGYTHVLIHELGKAFIEKHDARIHTDEWQALTLLRTYLREVNHAGAAYTLYEIP